MLVTLFDVGSEGVGRFSLASSFCTVEIGVDEDFL